MYYNLNEQQTGFEIWFRNNINNKKQILFNNML